MTHPIIKSATTEAYKVLVADDSPVIRRAFRAFPATEIVVRDIVADRAELLRAMTQAEMLDAVLCADHLGGQFGGVQVLNDLRDTQLLPPETAFILMSGDSRKANLMACLEAKPDEILLKPFSPEALVRKLATVVSTRRALAVLRTHAQRQDWPALLRVASDMLAQGTPYQDDVEQLRLEALGKVGQHDAISAFLQTKLQTSPNSVRLLEAFARHSHQMGRLEEAERALNRLVKLQPANLDAADLLAEVLLTRGALVEAQQRLQQALKQSPNSLQRHRVLGHLALFNGDTATAEQAYLFAMRQHAEVHGLSDEDVVNSVRVLLLQGDTARAWRMVGNAQMKLPHSRVLDLLARLTEALVCREYEALSRTQTRVTQGIAVLNEAGLPCEGVLILAAAEVCLMASLPLRADQLCWDLLHTKPHVKLHPAQKIWAERLHKWSRDVQNENLPQGLLHYQKYMK